MPINTIHYDLSAFSKGDKYSAIIDKQRFSIIENQLYFLSDIIDDGVINGWSVTENGTLSINISSGMGLINNVICRTFGDVSYLLNDNSEYYVYMQRKDGNEPGGVLGQFSNFTDYISYLYSHVTPPSKPTGLSLSSIYNNVSLNWNNNIELDLSYYTIQRSEDNIIYSDIGTSTTNSFNDTRVEQDTIYWYRISATDTSGNISSYSDSSFVYVPNDTSPPLPPSYFFILESDSSLQLAWNYSSVGSLNGYRITIQAVDQNYTPIGIKTTYNVGSDISVYVIDGLQNNQIYQVSICSISKADISSEVLSLYKIPKTNSGPAEISNLELSYQTDISNKKISLSVTGNVVVDPYFPLASKYIAYIIENGDITSDAINISFNNQPITIDVYSTNNKANFYNIKNRTEYIVLVKAQDVYGNLNNGVIAKVKTGNSISPASPSNINISLDTSTLNISWTNSVDLFDYNLIRITKKNISTESISEVLPETNILKSQSYILTDIENNYLYTVYLKCVDEYSLYSEEVSSSYSIEFSIKLPVPVPVGINAMGAQKQVLLLWDNPNYNYIDSYNIWRAEYKNQLTSSDFVFIDNVKYGTLSYLDYNVEEETEYVYFITSIDIFGNQSYNPVDNQYISYNFATAYTKNISVFSDIYNLSISKYGDYSLQLNWEQDFSEYDGYEIYRSIGDINSWEKVGNAKYSENSFIDNNVLISGTNSYYYIIRKYRDESRVILSNSYYAPDNSISIARITTDSGVINIEDTSCQIKSCSCMMSSYLTNAVETHHHTKNILSDKRIDLSENVIISSWVTSDNIVFITSDNISGASSYILKIDGVIPSVPYSLNIEENKIVFYSAITYSSITLECVGVSETFNNIKGNQLNSLDANQAEMGKVNNDKLPDISHFGRKEKLIPLCHIMSSEDKYTFIISENKNNINPISIGTANTFYDIIEIDSTNKIAATSKGILFTSDFSSWQTLYYDSYIINKLFYSSTLNKYFGLSNGYVYISLDGIGWSRTNKVGKSCIVRDIVDNGETVFVSTDCGVFKYDILDEGNWIEVSRYSGISTDCYSMIFLSLNNKILLSTDIGVFESSDDGDNWILSDYFDTKDIVNCFCESNGSIFAISNTKLFKEISGKFTSISNINSKKTRKIIIFQDKAFISSEDGIYISSDLNLENVSLTLREDCLFKNSKKMPATFLGEVNNSVLFATDKHIYSFDSSLNYNTVYSEEGSIAPTFYINGEECYLGVFYNSNNNTALFDRAIRYNENITVANQYQYFLVKNKGWINQRYDATINIYQNNSLKDSTERSSVPVSELASVSFDVFTEYNSNSSTANEYKSEYSTVLSTFQTLVGSYANSYHSYTVLSDGKTVQYYIDLLISLYHKAYSQFIGDIKYFSTISINDISYILIDNILYTYDLSNYLLNNYKLIEDIPTISVISTSNISFGDVSSGIISLSTNYDKYDNLIADISDTEILTNEANTHEEIDDKLEIYNSGLDARMSDIYNTNLFNFISNIYKYYNDNNLNLYQSDIIPIYTLHSFWYDYINSTVNFYEVFKSNGTDLCLTYITDCLFLDNLGKILITTINGLYSLDINTLSVSKVFFNNLDSNIVRFIKMIDDVIYLFTNSLMYITYDYGENWDTVDTTGIDGDYIAFSIMQSNWILCTSYGIYYKNIYNDSWTLSKQLSNITLLETPDIAFVVANNYLYSSGDGKTWSTGRAFDIQVNQMKKYGSVFILCTDSGLRFDNGTFYSSGSLSSSVFDVEGNLSQSSSLHFNDIIIRDDGLGFIAGNSEGNYYIMDSGVITKYTDSLLNSINKVLYVENSPWLFFNNMLKIPQFSYPIKLGAGIPF